MDKMGVFDGSSLIVLIYLIIQIVHQVRSHGRLIEPPARNTLWRFGFKAQANYNDNELFCGGIGGITRNEGKCGICGDPYDGVRMHETGKLMAQNKTVRNYFPGSSIDIMIEIVANHGGNFNFEICWRNDWDTVETEDCFERLKLNGRDRVTAKRIATTNQDGSENNVVESSESDKLNEKRPSSYELDPTSGTGLYTMSVDLPANRTCENCVLRWHWRAANNWGICEDGSEAIGCGYQEIYRNCADISVKRDGAGIGLSASILTRKK